MHSCTQSHGGTRDIHQTMYLCLIPAGILREYVIPVGKVSQGAYLSGIADSKDK
jgi:hypothetical protein